MKFDLKKPCKDCPFVKGSSTNCSLDPERLESIVKDVENDLAFTCHKTLDLPKHEQQHCGGALEYLEKQDNPNQLMRIAERLRLYDRSKLHMKSDLIEGPAK